MADSIAPLSPSVLRNLADKLYEKRKTAALEVVFQVSFMRIKLMLSSFIDKDNSALKTLFSLVFEYFQVGGILVLQSWHQCHTLCKYMVYCFV